MRPLALIPLLLMGWKPEDELATLVSMVDATLPESAELASAAGFGTVEVPVRLLNRYGAAVPGSGVELSVEGAAVAIDDPVVVLDPGGYGILEVEAEAPGAFTVSIASTDDPVTVGEPVTAWSLGGELPGWGLRTSLPLPAELGPVMFACPLIEGVALATEMEVWYQPVQPDAQAHRVLSMPDPILELEVVHVDVDGVADLMVRSSDEVVLLRGRSRGGFSWGAGFAAEQGVFQGASMDDVDGDTRADLGLAVQSDLGTFLVFMGGDGAWAFEELTERRFEPGYTVVDLQLSQSDSDGMAEVALLKNDSMLMRYFWNEDRWAETYPSSLETYLAEPASFLGAADLNLGGAEEPILLSHAETSVQQSMIFYTLDDNTVEYQKSYEAPYWGLSDLSGDGLTDIVVWSEGFVHLIHFIATEGNPDFAYHSVGAVQLFTGTDEDESFLGGPIAAGLLDGDDIPDLAMVKDALLVFPGKELEDSDGWASADGRWTSYDLGLLGDPLVLDLDGLPGLDTMAAWVEASTGPALRTWSIAVDPHGEPPSLERRGDAYFAGGAEPLGLVDLDGVFYGLVRQDELVELLAMGPEEDGDYVELGRVSLDAERLVVGSFAEGAALAAVSAEGAVTLLDAALTELGADKVGAHGCVVAADTDGDGIDELITGSDAGCSLLALDLDGDGVDELFGLDADGLSLSWAGLDHPLEGDGAIAAVDLDLDGQPELIAASGGQLRIHRVVGDSLAPGVGLHGVGLFAGTPRFGDFTGDGLPDIVVQDGAGLLKLLWHD